MKLRNIAAAALIAFQGFHGGAALDVRNAMGSTARTNFLKLALQNVDWTTFGSGTGLRGATTAGNLCIALAISTGTGGSTQDVNESTNWSPGGRQLVARGAGTWTVSTNQGSNTNAISWSQCTSGSDTITGFSAGGAASGASENDFYGSNGSNINVSANIVLSYGAGAMVITVT